MDSQTNGTANSIVEAKITDLAAALEAGQTTAVGLVTSYLLRIATYDTRHTSLNSVPLINPNVFNEAAASDDRRASGQSHGILEGIPFTVKDSYKVKGMTVASGSEAFQDLIASEDAFTVKALRNAGAILLGKTNMCPMAYGGMLRGVYGRAESPYNPKYLAAAFASGSSNGSGVSTAASFAAFGMGEETVSSGRSPASNNGLVAYTPSRGLISIRGNWPLYPTCDVVVPHTRSMADLLVLLDTLTTEDSNTVGDFWRDQPFLDMPQWRHRPNSFTEISRNQFLKGKRIAVPATYTGESPQASNVYTSDGVKELWSKTKSDLEASGATVEVVADFPAVRLYENASSEWPKDYPAEGKLPENWNTTERGTLIAHSWDDFLRVNNDANFRTLAAAAWQKIFPQMSRDDPQLMFSEVANAVHWSKLASYVENNDHIPTSGTSKMYDVPNLEQAVNALETMRKRLFEDWMDQHHFDFVAFPAAGDVGYAEADIDVDLARHTWKNGVKYSHANRCLRHLGIPSVTVPMGLIPDKEMPMGLTILGRAYDDVDILRAGCAVEQSRQKRMAPPLTPALPTDRLGDQVVDLLASRPELKVTNCSGTKGTEARISVSVEGEVTFSHSEAGNAIDPMFEIYIDGTEVSTADFKIGPAKSNNTSHFSGKWTVAAPPEQDKRNQVVGKIARDSTMIIILAKNGSRGRPNAWLGSIHASEVKR